MNLIGKIGGANAAWEHLIEWPEKLQERLTASWGRTDPVSVVSIWNRLGGVMGGDEKGSKLSETLKIEPAIFVKLFG